FIADVLALLRRHPLPYLRSLAQLLLLLRWKLSESFLIPLESLAFFRRKVMRTSRCIRGTVLVEVRSLDGLPATIWRAAPNFARVPRSKLGAALQIVAGRPSNDRTSTRTVPRMQRDVRMTLRRKNARDSRGMRNDSDSFHRNSSRSCARERKYGKG